jgi:hypothetical protein
VSALCFESRQSDDMHSPRLPKGRVPEVLTAMGRIWGELDQLEKDNNLSFLRPIDAGFAWAAYRWARGARLEAVLTESADLTPGDFVRAVKQLLDLLDQIANVAAGAGAGAGGAGGAGAGDGSGGSGSGGSAGGGVGSGGSAGGVGSGGADGAARDLASVAHDAMAALRRGVVAYSTVAD